MDRGYLKVYKKKFFVMNGRKPEYSLKDNKVFLLFMKTLRWKLALEQMSFLVIKSFLK